MVASKGHSFIASDLHGFDSCGLRSAALNEAGDDLAIAAEVLPVCHGGLKRT
eukprot:CAMPEP_0172941446 /NCGR_PEP_ID=MMETSP1075-20121228/224544_1 /TAXON_ID=2916 /ORGANISM="Ceratium fusus, Strain PA161109" /LENGTH=51 /DNA_ID=CAMNT_0013802859 /DNA_START=287 /DNA_END=442 /DNA_ORIENTATION=+